MENEHPIITAANGRQFAGFPAAVLAFIVNADEELLLLAHPRRGDRWEVPNGGLEAGETVLAGVLREVREEAGPQVRVRPLGVVHTSTFPYDRQVRHMISVHYLLAYEGGPVEPGDDMAGSVVRWWSLADLAAGAAPMLVPRESPWLFTRARDLYHLWQADSPPADLQVDLDSVGPNKYGS
jgi:ADP-ribose pyrophosphatase YjhB (NUDIX family)